MTDFLAIMVAEQGSMSEASAKQMLSFLRAWSGCCSSEDPQLQCLELGYYPFQQDLPSLPILSLPVPSLPFPPHPFPF